MRVFALLSFLACAAALNADLDDKEWEKPIQKVIRLMKEMQSQLDKEAEEDEDMMDKLSCWCDTNEKEKSQAVAVNTQRVTDLGAAIEELTAKSASLKTDIEELKKQVAASTASLEESTAMREKESSEFFAFEKDSIQNIESTKGAIMALSKVHGSSSLSQESLMQVKQVLKKQFAATHRSMSRSQNRAAMSLIQEPSTESEVDSLLQQSGEAPQSGAIFGILKQMKESMETGLDTGKTEEKTAIETYGSMKASKEEEIAAAEELIDSKTAELASTDEKNVASKEDLADTSATVDADTKFLASLKDKCDSAQADYNARSKVRNDEISAVAEAMEILTGDDAKDLLLKFVQVSSRRESRLHRGRASDFMAKMAKKLHSPKLSQLSMSMRLDAFTKIKANIDAMVAELKQTQKDEVVKKDTCGKELHENEMQTTAKNNEKADLESLIKDLETSKTTLAEEIEALKASVAEAQAQLKKASELRLAENKEFQITVTDQKATQEILAKALNRLKAFYEKKSFLQVRTEQPGYKKNAGSSSVMVMMEHIIEESKAEQADAIKSENDAVAAYAEYIADSTTSITGMQRSIINKSEELAKVDSKKAEAEGDLQTNAADLLSLLKMYQTLHNDCDFLLKYFDVRQTKRAEEIEALQQAKAIFSGAGR